MFLHQTPAFQPVSDCVLEHISQLIGAEKEALKRVHGEVLTQNLSLYPESRHVTLTFSYNTNTQRTSTFLVLS